jgi:hypothetical protein
MNEANEGPWQGPGSSLASSAANIMWCTPAKQQGLAREARQCHQAKDFLAAWHTNLLGPPSAGHEYL